MDVDDEARVCHMAAVELIEAFPALQSAHAADVYADAGRFLDKVGDYAGAMRMFRRELPLVAGRARESAVAFNNLANAMDALGQARTAPPLYLSSLSAGAQSRGRS
jgi:tetratricopeptide (TPR) repeat protein